MRIAQLLAGAALTALVSSVAVAAPVTFTKLTGVTGGTLAATAVYQADLSGVGGSILSITINDNSAGLGGSPGQFSGFDLDAIILSSTVTVGPGRVPEPATVALLAIALVGLAIALRRKK